MIKNVTLGADPELFLYDSEKKEIVSAEGLIGGTKEEPLPITDKGHSIQEDNVMAEFNIPPVTDAESFARELILVVKHIDNMLPENLSTLVASSAYLDPKYLKTDQAMTFGCEPDYCAWTFEMNESPEEDSELRTCGGHIHVGYDNPNSDDSIDIIRALDLFLGVPSVIMDNDRDRRKMYGRAGAFRGKDYGVEYRTLSNFWLGSKELMKWAFNATIAAIDWINAGNKIDKELGETISDCINTSNTSLALKLIEKYNLILVKEEIEEEVKSLENA